MMYHHTEPLLQMSSNLQDIIELFERTDTTQYEKAGGLHHFAQMFETDVEKGITKVSPSDLKARIEKFGSNVLPDPPSKSWCRLFIETFSDLMLKILLISAVLSIILTSVFTPKEELSFMEYIDTISIFVAVLIVSIVQAQTNYAQQKSFLEINQLKNNYPVSVIRNGESMLVQSTEIYVGDLVEIKTGDCVAADAFYVSGQNITINNSAQTGEPIAVKVDSKNPFLRGGGAIESGIGVIMIAAVGPNSQSGVTMMKIQEIGSEKQQSPLEKKLDKLGLQITYIGLAGSILTFLVLLGFWSKDVDTMRKSGVWDNGIWSDLVDQFMVGVTIFICAVPEGLPLAVTLSLSFSMKRMMHDNNFVRHLNACETMGGATTICSDKTGTLTQNKMTVVKFYQVGREQGESPELSKDVIDLYSTAVAVNSTASQTIKEGSDKPIFIGSSSECALLQMIAKLGKDFDQIRKQNPAVIINEFNSARKRMSTVCRNGSGYRAYLKGAPDFCLPFCRDYIDSDGNKYELTEAISNTILEKVTAFASESLRTMLIAYREVNSASQNEIEDPDFVERDMTLIAIVGIMDPLRPEVIDAVKACHTAGVVVRMVTGDFIATARAISKQCGILENDTDLVMEGRDFAKMSKLDLVDKIDNLKVLARSSPTDKYRLVSLLMECGEVVAVTGDGSNDSSALKKANVGLSMGMCGTELAKIASDIVILDDNFNSIVNALKWGRCVYDNVKSFLQFQLTVNFSAIIIAVVGSIALQTSPLKAIQLLWVNLIMDSLGALALGTRSPVESLLQRPPYGESDGLISNILMRNIAGHSIYQTIVLLMILFGHDVIFNVKDDSPDKSYTSSLLFNTFVFMQVFNLINARVAANEGGVFDGFFQNWYFIAIMILISLLQFLIIHFGGSAFQTKRLNGVEWGITLAFGVGSLIIGFFLRLFKLRDRTTEKLNAHRAERKEAVRKMYQGMTSEEQWNTEYVTDEERENRTKEANEAARKRAILGIDDASVESVPEL